MEDRPRPVRSIALMNQKGGVGKTTTSVNLAAGIARLGRRTLLVDLDPQAHATLHLGVEAGGGASGGPSVYDLLHEPGGAGAGAEGQRGAAAAAVRCVADNLDLIPSETALAAAESELAGEPDRNLRLKRAIEGLSGGYEFVLLDCPPSLGLLTLNALAAAREVFIPMQAHFLALQGVSKLLETVSLVSRQVNPRLRVTGVVLCMHDTQATHSREVVADMDAFFEAARGRDVPWRSARVYRPHVRRNIKLAECPSFGRSIFDYDASSPGALDYAALAEKVVREWDELLERQDRDAAGAVAPPTVTVPATRDAEPAPGAP